jgi:hypothetical protein
MKTKIEICKRNKIVIKQLGMLARIALSTYLTGVGASGLYGIFLSSSDFENKKRLEKEEDPDICEPQISEFIRYSGACCKGFGFGLILGFMWPIGLLGATFSFINQIDVINKNN